MEDVSNPQLFSIILSGFPFPLLVSRFARCHACLFVTPFYRSFLAVADITSSGVIKWIATIDSSLFLPLCLVVLFVTWRVSVRPNASEQLTRSGERLESYRAWTKVTRAVFWMKNQTRATFRLETLIQRLQSVAVVMQRRGSMQINYAVECVQVALKWFMDPRVRSSHKVVQTVWSLDVMQSNTLQLLTDILDGAWVSWPCFLSGVSPPPQRLFSWRSH